MKHWKLAVLILVAPGALFLSACAGESDNAETTSTRANAAEAAEEVTHSTTPSPVTVAEIDP